jgi:hypothetical protein
VDAPLTPLLELEVFDGVGHVDAVAIDIGCGECLSNNRPAGPTNGSPALSSWSPGCSPTIISHALVEPDPKTVWVALRYRSQR